MKSRKCGSTRQKRALMLVRAVLPVAATATPSLVFAQSLSVVTFSGTGYTLNTTSNYTGSPAGTPGAGDLIDITGVEAFAGSTSSSVYSAAIHASGSSTTTVNAGAVVFDLASAIPSGKVLTVDATSTTTTGTFSAGTLAIAGGAVLTTLSSGATVNAGDLIELTSNVGGLVDLGQTAIGTFDLVIPAAGGNFDVAPNSTLELGYNSVTTGSGPINITGGGTVTLNDNSGNSLTGGITISAGTLSVFNAAGFGTAGSSPTTINGGVLSFAQSEQLNTARSIILDQAASDIDVPTNGTGSVSIPGSLTGVGGLLKTGGGTLTLSGTNTFNGSETIAGGVLQISTATQLGATPTTPTNNIILSGGTLMLTGITSTPAFNANRTVVLGNGASGGVGTIDVSSNAAAFGGAFVDSGGAGTLTKIDTGTLILENGSSTYSGGTNVNAGLLLVANGSTGTSATGTGPVNVGGTNAGSFGGNGTVAGNITVNSTGTLVPGSFQGSSIVALQPGTLNGGGSLALNTSSTVIEKLASQSSYDTTNIVGNITLGSTVDLTLVSVGGFQPSPSDSYVLFTITGAGMLSGFTPTTNNASGTFVVSAGATGWDVSNASVYEDQNGPDGETEIVLTGVPEPTSAAALLGSGCMLLRRRRKTVAAQA